MSDGDENNSGITFQQLVNAVFNVIGKVLEARISSDVTLPADGKLSNEYLKLLYPETITSSNKIPSGSFGDININFNENIKYSVTLNDLVKFLQLVGAIESIVNVYMNDNIPNESKELVALMTFLSDMFGFPLPADVAGLYASALHIVTTQEELMQEIIWHHPEAFPTDGSGKPYFPTHDDLGGADVDLPPPPDNFDDMRDAPPPSEGEGNESPEGEYGNPTIGGTASEGLDIARGNSSPLILDLGVEGTQLFDVASNNLLFWDVDLDGYAEKSGWVGSEDGLLAIDLNGDGIINDHSELFGTADIDGFSVLSVYDTNYDGVIDAKDKQFSDLIVWVDANSDTYSQSGEMVSLSALGITSISLAATQVNYTISGNYVTHESTFTMNGQTRSIIDAWFAYDDVNTIYSVSDYEISIEALLLPNLKGFGTVPYLQHAMSQDQTLLNMVKEVALIHGNTVFSHDFDLQGKIEAIMYRWAGVDSVDPVSRGDNIDARKLAFLEAVTGQGWMQNGISPNPGSGAAIILEDTFQRILGIVTGQLMVQTSAKEYISENAHYNDLSGVVEGAWSIDYLRYLNETSGNLTGSENNDFYIYNLGDGSLKITDNGGADKIIFGPDIEFEDIRLWNAGYDLQIYVGADVITLDDQFRSDSEAYAGRLIETAKFSDDSTLNLLNNLTFTGTELNDSVYGLADDNVIIGAGGNDTLYGDAGDDTYLYNLGDGNDKITDASGQDHIVFGDGITSDNIRFWKVGYDLKIYVGSGILTLDDQFRSDSETYAGRLIESAKFFDDSTLNLLNNLTFTGTELNDSVYGLADDNVIIGAGGNDTLYGDAGDDTYLYNLGDGNDKITDASGQDQIVFGDGITSDNIRFWKVGYDLKIYVGSGILTLDDQFRSDDDPYIGRLVETAKFCDGATLDLFNNLSFTGTNAGETVYGLSDDNFIIGLKGNDTLYGEAGNDTYLYSLGDGNDKITDSDGIDKILFGEDITSANISFRTTGYDLEIHVGGDVITLDDQLRDDTDYYANRFVERVEFSNGSTLSLANNLSFVGTSANETIYGTNNDDVIIGKDGEDHLYGRGGHDTFILEAIDYSSSYDILEDFSVADDKLDISGILDVSDWSGVIATINDYVSVRGDASYTYVDIDLDGAGAAHSKITVARLDTGNIWSSAADMAGGDLNDSTGNLIL